MLNLIKFSSLNNVMLQGPVVDSIIQTVQMMFGLGAPIERNDIGFNQGDYSNPILQRVSSLYAGASVSANDLGACTYALMKYRNRQVPNAPELRKQFEEELNKVQMNQPPNQENKITPELNQNGKLKIQNLGAGQYGKIKFYIPELETRFSATKINTYLRRKAQELGWRQVTNSYGNVDYELFKAFTRSKNQPNQIEVLPIFIPALIEMFEENNRQINKKNAVNYDYSELTQINTAEPQQSMTNNGKEKVKVLNGTQNEITIKFNYDAETINLIKTIVPPRCRKYNGNTKSWTFHDANFIDITGWVAQIFGAEKYDSSEIQDYLKQHWTKIFNEGFQQKQENLSGEGSIRPLQAVDVSDTSNFMVGLSFPREDAARMDLSELIKFSFPSFGPDGQRDIDKNRPNWLYMLKGSYSDFVDFYRLLKSRNFDTTQLTQILATFTKPKEQGGKGILQKENVEGWINGKSANTPEIIAHFNNRIKQLLQPEITPYDKQYEGMAHLYSRKSSLLGDSTGAGKSMMTIAAANLKLKETNGKALIITMKTPAIQWMREIRKVLGPDDSISFNPVDGAKWTITYYNQWSESGLDKSTIMIDPATGEKVGGKKRDVLMKNVVEQNYSVLILDEVHCIKNDSIRSENILTATQNIPFRWGLSATVVANKPMDAHRVLKGIGHRLGDLTSGQFKREFAGMVPGGYGGAYIDGSEAEQRQAAEKLRKWLAISGVYIKRTKEDMNPNMPKHSIEDLPVKLKENEMDSLNRRISERLRNYKDPELAISNMIAERTELALAKIPYSLEMAQNILEQDRKVLIFTCFRDPAIQIANGITNILKNIQKEQKSAILGKVVTIIGGTKDREGDIQNFKQDPNVRAMVLSILAGGTGLDLPNVVNDVIINDFSWTPKDAEQSEGRAFRINSLSDVETNYIVATDTADEIYYSDVQRKKEIAKIVQDLDQAEAEAQRENRPVNEIRIKRNILMQEVKKIENETKLKLLNLVNKKTAYKNWYKTIIKS